MGRCRVSQQRLPSVGGTVTADGEGGGLQLGHAELVEQFVIGAVGADRRERIRHRLRQLLVAEGEGDVGAGNVPDPDFCDTALLERVGGLIDVERRLELSGAKAAEVAVTVVKVRNSISLRPFATIATLNSRALRSV
jgi:hypothetical protein